MRAQAPQATGDGPDVATAADETGELCGIGMVLQAEHSAAVDPLGLAFPVERGARALVRRALDPSAWAAARLAAPECRDGVPAHKLALSTMEPSTAGAGEGEPAQQAGAGAPVLLTRPGAAGSSAEEARADEAAGGSAHARRQTCAQRRVQHRRQSAQRRAGGGAAALVGDTMGVGATTTLDDPPAVGRGSNVLHALALPFTPARDRDAASPTSLALGNSLLQLQGWVAPAPPAWGGPAAGGGAVGDDGGLASARRAHAWARAPLAPVSTWMWGLPVPHGDGTTRHHHPAAPPFVEAGSSLAALLGGTL